MSLLQWQHFHHSKCNSLKNNNIAKALSVCKHQTIMQKIVDRLNESNHTDTKQKVKKF